MSRHSGALHSDMFDRKPAGLESHAFPECTGHTRRLVNDIGFSSIEVWLLQRLRRSIGNPPIRLILGKHKEVAPPSGKKAIVTVSISDRRTLAKVLFSPEIAFGDGYTDGSIVVDGDLVELTEQVIRLMRMTKPEPWWAEWRRNGCSEFKPTPSPDPQETLTTTMI